MENLRREIDSIDRELIQLFIKRMKTVGAISEYKKANGLPVFDEKRETEKITRAISGIDEEYRGETEEFIRFLMEISKRRQKKLRGEKDI